MAEIVVVGSLSMDLTAATARLPAPGETVLGSSFAMVPGGKGNNQAVACARQGVATAMVGRVGSDDFGAAIRAQLVAEGVDVSQLTTDPSFGTGIAHITVDAAGQNFIIAVPRSNHALTARHVAEAAGLIEHAAVLLVQLEVRLEVVQAALDLARRAGTTTMLNPAPALAVSDELLSKVDLCLPNEVEAATLTGFAVDDVAGAVRAGRALVSRGCGAAVVTLGGRGSVYVDAERVLAVPSFEVPVVDTVAAGDAFCGVLASALARGRDLESSLVRASAAGALAVQVAGATPSLPTAGALEEILGRIPAVEVRRYSPPPP
ncbi:MAG: ribokinase [Acidimicrobiales bacterium]|jgi:ribokinase